MSKPFNIEKFNAILKEYNQTLRATKITGKEIVLSNGLVITNERDLRLCKKRIMSGATIWKENFDKIYSLNKIENSKVERMCRSAISAKGGVNCQKQHKEKIKSNLNTGIPWNKGMKGNYPYSYPCTNFTKKKISDANRGENNGMFGKPCSQERKAQLSETMRKNILTGKFTPNSNNRNTHWNSYYKNKKYRSSWEALYQHLDEEAEYETLRIPYTFNNKDYIYIIDFVNYKTRSVIEVKPHVLLNNKKIQAKIHAAKKWCSKNGFFFVLVDEEFLKSKGIPDNLTDFDLKTQRKIRKLYETN